MWSPGIGATDASVTTPFLIVRVTPILSAPPGDIYEPVAVYVPSLYGELATVAVEAEVVAAVVVATGVVVVSSAVVLGAIFEPEPFIEKAMITATMIITASAMLIPIFLCEDADGVVGVCSINIR